MGKIGSKRCSNETNKILFVELGWCNMGHHQSA